MTEFRYEYNGGLHTIRLEPEPDGSYFAHIGDQTFEVALTVEPDGALNMSIDGQRVQAYAEAGHTDTRGAQHHHVALLCDHPQSYELKTAQMAARRRGALARAGSLDAPMPGQVIDLLVKEGDFVEQGEPMLILEAMKMEIRVKAPHNGTVMRVCVVAGDTVERGQELVQIAPDEK